MSALGSWRGPHLLRVLLSFNQAELGTVARVRRPLDYLALRTLTHATSTRARAYDVRHIMFGTL
jgi:hypothetical protein